MKPSVEPEFLPESEDFRLGSVLFRVDLTGKRDASDRDGVALLKRWALAAAEMDALGDLEVARMLEFGVHEGGSAALWALSLPLRRYLGIDIRPLHLAFPSALTDDPRWDVVRLKGGVSQDDRKAVGSAVEEWLGGNVDLIIDDASHQYGLSRATFEATFWRLRPGGAYVIEDWSWAQNPGPWDRPEHFWHGRPSLANLVTRLALIPARHPNVVSRLDVRKNFAIVWRGSAPAPSDIDVDELAGDRQLHEVI